MVEIDMSVLEDDSSLSSEFLYEQYKALRAEILAKQERLFRVMSIGITGIPILAGAGLKIDLNPLVLASPFITLVFFLELLFEQNSIMRAGRFIRTELETRLLKEQEAGWEYYLERENVNRIPERFFTFAVYIIFALYFVMSSYLAWQISKEMFSVRVAIAILLSLVIIFVICVLSVIKFFPRGTKY